MEKYSRIKALISLDAVLYNFEQMKKSIKEGTKIIAVIKADAYGHGAVPISRMLEELDYVWGFATATAQEALQLRRAGITRPILIIPVSAAMWIRPFLPALAAASSYFFAVS